MQAITVFKRESGEEPTFGVFKRHELVGLDVVDYRGHGLVGRDFLSCSALREREEGRRRE